MKAFGKFSDKRVKKGLFPLSTFVLFFFMFAFLTTIQMFMIGQAIDYKNLANKKRYCGYCFLDIGFRLLNTHYRADHQTALSEAH